MKNELQARIGYDSEKDAYELLLSSDGGNEWYMSFSAKCQHSVHDKPDDEPMFIHVNLITALKNAIANGFEIVY